MHVNSNPILACCTRDACSSMASPAVCPRQSLPSYFPCKPLCMDVAVAQRAAGPRGMRLKGVLFDIVTNPSCTAGCGLAEGREESFPHLWLCVAAGEGCSNITLLCSIFFPYLKENKPYEKVPFSHA